MAKFYCVCGYLIRMSGEIPHPYEWLLTSDVEFDKYSGQVDIDQVYMRSIPMFRCPESDHLWIYWNGFEELPRLYSPE